MFTLFAFNSYPHTIFQISIIFSSLYYRSNLFVSQSVKLKTCITSEFISPINMLNHPRNFNQKERKKKNL